MLCSSKGFLIRDMFCIECFFLFVIEIRRMKPSIRALTSDRKLNRAINIIRIVELRDSDT